MTTSNADVPKYRLNDGAEIPVIALGTYLGYDKVPKPIFLMLPIICHSKNNHETALSAYYLSFHRLYKIMDSPHTVTPAATHCKS